MTSFFELIARKFFIPRKNTTKLLIRDDLKIPELITRKNLV